MRIIFRPEASAELLEAQAWYEARSIGLGSSFARSFEAALASAARQPFAHPCVEGLVRRVLLRRFPYALFYRAAAAELLVVAVFHHRRDPAVLKGRQKSRPDP
jgi:plasmid stabilization system protein ParE